MTNRLLEAATHRDQVSQETKRVQEIRLAGRVGAHEKHRRSRGVLTSVKLRQFSRRMWVNRKGFSTLLAMPSPPQHRVLHRAVPQETPAGRIRRAAGSHAQSYIIHPSTRYAISTHCPLRALASTASQTFWVRMAARKLGWKAGPPSRLARKSARPLMNVCS